MEKVVAFQIGTYSVRHTISIQYIGLVFRVKVSRAMPIQYLEVIFLQLIRNVKRNGATICAQVGRCVQMRVRKHGCDVLDSHVCFEKYSIRAIEYFFPCLRWVPEHFISSKSAVIYPCSCVVESFGVNSRLSSFNFYLSSYVIVLGLPLVIT